MKAQLPRELGAHNFDLGVDRAELASAIYLLLQLAVEFEEASDPKRDDPDAIISRELFRLAGTGAVLTSLIDSLKRQRKAREELIVKVRAARYTSKILEVLPARDELPPDAGIRVKEVAVEFGLELTEEQTKGVLEGVRHQKRGDGQRATRVYEAVAKVGDSPRTVQELVRVVRESYALKVPSGKRAGKIKTSEHLEVAWHERVSAGGCLEYVLGVLGGAAPEAAARALRAWSETLLEELPKRATPASHESRNLSLDDCEASARAGAYPWRHETDTSD